MTEKTDDILRRRVEYLSKLVNVLAISSDGGLSRCRLCGSEWDLAFGGKEQHGLGCPADPNPPERFPPFYWLKDRSEKETGP